jgi:hypothetical protein
MPKASKPEPPAAPASDPVATPERRAFEVRENATGGTLLGLTTPNESQTWYFHVKDDPVRDSRLADALNLWLSSHVADAVERATAKWRASCSRVVEKHINACSERDEARRQLAQLRSNNADLTKGIEARDAELIALREWVMKQQAQQPVVTKWPPGAPSREDVERAVNFYSTAEGEQIGNLRSLARAVLAGWRPEDDCAKIDKATAVAAGAEAGRGAALNIAGGIDKAANVEPDAGNDRSLNAGSSSPVGEAGHSKAPPPAEPINSPANVDDLRRLVDDLGVEVANLWEALKTHRDLRRQEAAALRTVVHDLQLAMAYRMTLMDTKHHQAGAEAVERVSAAAILRLSPAETNDGGNTT